MRSDDGYYDYDVWEPTEQEIVDVYVSDDAEDPESDFLMQRQQARWDDLLQRQKQRADLAEEQLTRASDPDADRRQTPTWWKLWTPPQLELEQRSWQVSRRAPVKQGSIEITHEVHAEDIHGFYGERPIRALRSQTTWMDFKPDQKWGQPDLSFLADRNGILTRDRTHGNWGWWDNEKGVIRCAIKGAVCHYDPDHMELGLVDFAVKMVHPPPYGLWMPTFVSHDPDNDLQ